MTYPSVVTASVEMPMWSLMTDVCRAMGVRTDVPFSELTPAERAIVFDGPAEKRHILYKAKNSNQAGELDFTYYNAVYTVENALAKVKDEKGMKRVEKFLKEDVCPECGGTRLSAAARIRAKATQYLDKRMDTLLESGQKAYEVKVVMETLRLIADMEKSDAGAAEDAAVQIVEDLQ